MVAHTTMYQSFNHIQGADLPLKTAQYWSAFVALNGLNFQLNKPARKCHKSLLFEFLWPNRDLKAYLSLSSKGVSFIYCLH